MHRHDQRYVGEVGAAAERIVEDDDVAGFERALVYSRAYGHRHGA
jgi:hypothetical protein